MLMLLVCLYISIISQCNCVIQCSIKDKALSLQNTLCDFQVNMCSAAADFFGWSSWFYLCSMMCALYCSSCSWYILRAGTGKPTDPVQNKQIPGTLTCFRLLDVLIHLINNSYFLPMKKLSNPDHHALNIWEENLLCLSPLLDQWDLLHGCTVLLPSSSAK